MVTDTDTDCVHCKAEMSEAVTVTRIFPSLPVACVPVFHQVHLGTYPGVPGPHVLMYSGCTGSSQLVAPGTASALHQPLQTLPSLMWDVARPAISLYEIALRITRCLGRTSKDTSILPLMSYFLLQSVYIIIKS